MRRCIGTCAVWLVACRAPQPAPVASPPAPASAPTPTAPPPPAAPPTPLLTFREAFAIPFAATVTALRMDAVEGPCRVGLQYRRTSTISAHPSFELWSYAQPHGDGVTCDPTSAAHLPVMVRAVEQLAGLGTMPIVLDLSLRGDAAALQRYLAAVAPLPPDADEAVVAKRVFDRNVLAPWQRFVDDLGYRMTGIELFRLEPETELPGLPAAQLRTLAAPGPYPPRLPVRVSLILERKGPLVAIGNRAATPRTFRGLYGIAFEVAISSLSLRAELTDCSPTIQLGRGSVRLGSEPATCELTTAHEEKELPAMFRAGSELLDTSAASSLTMATSFATVPVLEKWIPVIRKLPREKDYAKLRALMKEHGVFGHLEPFIAAIGYKLREVSIEKVGTESGAALLAKHPSLASTGLSPRDSIQIPLMTILVLER